MSSALWYRILRDDHPATRFVLLDSSGFIIEQANVTLILSDSRKHSIVEAQQHFLESIHIKGAVRAQVIEDWATVVYRFVCGHAVYVSTHR